jgi:hypothetical protein
VPPRAANFNNPFVPQPLLLLAHILSKQLKDLQWKLELAGVVGYTCGEIEARNRSRQADSAYGA